MRRLLVGLTDEDGLCCLCEDPNQSQGNALCVCVCVCVAGRSGVDLISQWVEITLGATPHWVWLQISFNLQPMTQFLVGKNKEREGQGTKNSQSALSYPKAGHLVSPQGP